MKFSVELLSAQPFFLQERSFFKIGVKTKGEVKEKNLGLDRYERELMVLSKKRVAGLGREAVYRHLLLPVGTGIGEAVPGTYIRLKDYFDVEVIIETNAIRDIEKFRHYLELRLINEMGNYLEILLSRPDVEIYIDEQGRYAIPISSFLKKLKSLDKMPTHKTINVAL